MHFFCIFLQKNLVVSKNCSIFAVKLKNKNKTIKKLDALT